MLVNSDMTLICLPFAGGSSAAFSSWSRIAPDRITIKPVDYPGRGRRAAEPCALRVEDILEAVLCDLQDTLLSGPYALFGHSFGALLSYELTLKILEAGFPEPQMIFVSAAVPPHRLRLEQRHQQTDEEFLAHIRDLGALPNSLFDQPEALRFFTKVLRSDFTALERFHWGLKTCLACPIHVIHSENDTVIETDRLEDWKFYTSSAVSRYNLGPGGHMYLESRASEIVDYIERQLTAF